MKEPEEDERRSTDLRCPASNKLFGKIIHNAPATPAPPPTEVLLEFSCDLCRKTLGTSGRVLHRFDLAGNPTETHVPQD